MSIEAFVKADTPATSDTDGIIKLVRSDDNRYYKNQEATDKAIDL